MTEPVCPKDQHPKIVERCDISPCAISRVIPRVIAFDADDTLWHNEGHFRDTEKLFRELLSPYHDPEWIQARLFEVETRNLTHYGYGVKSFVLSMIETALQLTEGRIQGHEIARILDLGREMLAHPVQLLPHVKDCIQNLYGKNRLWVITKGDLLDQESKLARSGLGDFFECIDVVTEKTPESYAKLLKRHHIEPDRFLMIGNSVKSDILPVLEIGGHALHIPYPETWEYEQVTGDLPDFPVMASIKELPKWLGHD